MPAATRPHTEVRRLGACIDARGHDLVVRGRYATLDSNRCVEAVWGFEAVGVPPGYIPGTPATIRGWDPGTKTLASAESGLVAPPAHVHVEIEASTRSPIQSGLGGRTAKGYHAVSDKLLSARRTRPVSLGWARWSGRYGQLVLDPVFPSGGEWGGHLIFYFTSGRTNYAITLHAWLPAVRIDQRHATRIIRGQPGPSLPHVISTLAVMVHSATGH